MPDQGPETPSAPDATHEEHASRWRRVLREVEHVAKLTGNLDRPEVLALIPANLRGYALAIAAVEHAVEHATATSG